MRPSVFPSGTPRLECAGDARAHQGGPHRDAHKAFFVYPFKNMKQCVKLWYVVQWQVNLQFDEVRDGGPTAAWRSSRRNHYEWLATILANGCRVSPLHIAVPWIPNRLAPLC